MDNEITVTVPAPEPADDSEELDGTLSLVVDLQRETLNEVKECRSQQSNLSTHLQAENPILSQLVTGQAEIRSQLGSLNQSISDLRQSTLKPVESTPAPEPMVSLEPSLENPMEDSNEDEPPAPKPEKRRKFRLL